MIAEATPFRFVCPERSTAVTLTLELSIVMSNVPFVIAVKFAIAFAASLREEPRREPGVAVFTQRPT